MVCSRRGDDQVVAGKARLALPTELKTVIGGQARDHQVGRAVVANGQLGRCRRRPPSPRRNRSRRFICHADTVAHVKALLGRTRR